MVVWCGVVWYGVVWKGIQPLVVVEKEMRVKQKLSPGRSRSPVVGADVVVIES